MSETVILAEHLSKQYRLGSIGYQTFNAAFAGKIARLLGKEDPSAMLDATGAPVDQVNEKFWALDDVSFSLQQGDALGVIGSNGAGKSTLLKLLTGITTPTRGRFEITGRIASLLEVGTGFHPEMTGRENVYMNGAILGMSKQEIDRKFDEIVDFAEVAQFIDTPVKRYSSGMYVRLAFSIASHLNTEIVIVDEVLAVGDAEFQKKCLRQMDYASRGEGRTVLFVSHNLTAIRNLCTKCILLEKGRLIASGPMETVTNLYLKRSTAKLGGYSVDWTEEPERAPQVANLRMRRMFLTDAAGMPLETVSVDDDIDVNFDFEIRIPAANTCLTLLLYTRNGELVFYSVGNRQDWYKAAAPVGRYRSRVRIPSQFLNNGEYTLGFRIEADCYQYYDEFRDVMFLSVEDGYLYKGNFPEPIPGITRPALDWETKPIE